MKRFITLVLLIAYSASAIGLSFSLHYCGGHLKNICFTSDTEKNCCGKNEHKSHCCKDKHFSAKFKDDHSRSVYTVLIEMAAAVPVTVVHQQRSLCYAETAYSTSFPTINSPPWRNVPVYLLNCTFRI